MNHLLTTVIVSAGLAFVSSVANAASVTVGVSCTMRNAVASVNGNAATGGCSKSGFGIIDTINVPAGTYSDNGELQIHRAVKIVGAGRNSTTFESGGVSALNANGTSAFVFEIRDMTVRKLASQPFPCIGLRASSPARLVMNNVRVTGFNSVAGVFLEDGSGATGLENTITNSVIEHNTNVLGIRADTADVTITRSTISNNRGGIRVATRGFLYIYDSTIRDNTLSSGNGGGIFIEGTSSGQLHMQRSLVRNNRATTGYGGGVYSAGQVLIHNSTFTANRALRGGGLYHVGAESTLIHTTFSGNTGDESAGGVFHNGGQSRWFFNIFANNVAPLNPDAQAVWVATKRNIVENSAGYTPMFPSNDILNQDPKLGWLTDYGNGVLAFPLLAGSAAIDRIPASDQDALAVDQRGRSRPVNGPDGSGRDGFDIGSIEQRP